MEKAVEKPNISLLNAPATKFSKNLPRRIVLDCCSGFLGAFSVAPVMLMVDKAVVEKAAG